jgi:iron(III) transport system ATP-binding protein
MFKKKMNDKRGLNDVKAVKDEASALNPIELRNVSKSFTRQTGEKVQAIDDLSLTVTRGDFLVLLGPSGCGKTTLLRTMAGLETITAGTIHLEDKLVADPGAKVNISPEKRGVSMMFQSYALWPHMTVAQNVEYPLLKRNSSNKNYNKGERKDRVKYVLEAMGLENLETQYPGQISGGQQQRVALARALVSGGSIVFFDEPLSNVDAKVRESVRAEIKDLHKRLGFTAVYVTHDQEEATVLGTKIAVLREGKIAQIGSPKEVYEQPASPYVARFMGSGNELTGKVTSVKMEGSPVVEIETAFEPIKFIPENPKAFEAGDSVTVFTRPEHWTMKTSAAVPSEAMSDVGMFGYGVIHDAEYHGPYTDYFVEVDESLVKVRGISKRAKGQPEVGDSVFLSIDTEYVKIFNDDRQQSNTNISIKDSKTIRNSGPGEGEKQSRRSI